MKTIGDLIESLKALFEIFSTLFEKLGLDEKIKEIFPDSDKEEA